MENELSFIKKLFTNHSGIIKNQYKPLRVVILNFAFAIMVYIACMSIALKNPAIDTNAPQSFLYGFFEIKYYDGAPHNALSWIGWLLLSLTILELIFSVLICFYLRYRYTKPFLINSFVMGSFILAFFGLITGIPVAFDKEYLGLFHDGSGIGSPINPSAGDNIWISNLFYYHPNFDGVGNKSLHLTKTWLYWFDTAFYIVFNILGQASNVFTLKKFYQKNFVKRS